MDVRSQLIVGGVFIAAVVPLNFLLMGPAIFALNIGLAVSYIVWASGIRAKYSNELRIAAIFSIGVFIQVFHMLEEYFTGFHIVFPQMFGYVWAGELFLTFNISWLAVFMFAVWGVSKNVRIAYFPLWFFTLIGGIGNGLFHPLLSIIRREYFPGLVTSIPHFIVGIVLLRELLKARGSDNSGSMSKTESR